MAQAPETIKSANPPRDLPRDLPRLTSMRAFAALAVFVFHLYRSNVLTLPGGTAGYVGVAFFFVLSGFVLTWSYKPGLPPGRFWERRFARIWPSHFVMWLVAFAVPVTAFRITGLGAVLNLVLVQAWWPDNRIAESMDGVTWSLSCEAAFYLAFPFVLARFSRMPLRAVWAWAIGSYLVASVLVLALGHRTPLWESFVYKDPAIRFPEFLLGIAAALAVRQGWRLNWRVVAPVVAGCLVGLALYRAHTAVDVWMIPLFLLIVVWAATTDIDRPGGLLAAPWLVYCGKVSFAFYLVHDLVIQNLQHALPTASGPVVSVLALATSCVAAALLHHVVEHPAQQRLTAWFGSTRGRRPAGPATSAA